jgi:hypothetical protein
VIGNVSGTFGSRLNPTSSAASLRTTVAVVVARLTPASIRDHNGKRTTLTSAVRDAGAEAGYRRHRSGCGPNGMTLEI